MKYRVRIIQEFTIEAKDEEAARYAAIYRVARFADKGGSDEKAGKWNARAHDPVLDSLVAEASGADGDKAAVSGGDTRTLPQGRGRKALAAGLCEDRLQLGFLSEPGDSSGSSDPLTDEIKEELGLF